MATCSMECDGDTTLLNPEIDHRRVAASPTEWSDESDSWFDDEQEFDAEAFANAQYETFTDSDSDSDNTDYCRLWRRISPTPPANLEQRILDWKGWTDEEGNYVSRCFVTSRTRVFMDSSGNPMTYADKPHNVRLMMPRPIPPPESSHALRKGLWDCHVVDSQVVITQHASQEAESLGPGYVDAGSLSRVSRMGASDTKRVRRVPVGPRPMKRRATPGMCASISAMQEEYSMAAVAHLKEASESSATLLPTPWCFERQALPPAVIHELVHFPAAACVGDEITLEEMMRDGGEYKASE